MRRGNRRNYLYFHAELNITRWEQSRSQLAAQVKRCYELTNDGVSARCLLNPLIRIGGIININQRDIADAKLSNVSNDLQVNSAPQTTADGLYRVLVAEFVGDTFGNDWYTDITCISYDNSAPDGEKVSIS